MHRLVPISDPTHVAEARRHAVAFAQSEGLDEQASQEVAIITTEIATNILKHAGLGEMYLSCLSAAGDSGVEILSIDRGPGTANLHVCMADGFSTAGTLGTGLGAIARLADVFDAYSQPGRGTLVMARKFRQRHEGMRNEKWVFGAIMVPHPNETVSGDNWGVRPNGSGTSAIVADGLGHGILAAEASAAAVAAFHNGATRSVAEVLERVHLALRSTRGAAVAVSRIDHENYRVVYAGLGNISGVLLGGARAQFMVSLNGTAGMEARRFQEFEYTLPPDGALVMHSDGINTSWSVEAYPGLLRRHPSVIAGILYRDASRGRDDACVLVGRFMRECR